MTTLTQETHVAKKKKKKVFDPHTNILKLSGCTHTDCAKYGKECFPALVGETQCCKYLKYKREKKNNVFYSKVLPYLIEHNKISSENTLKRTAYLDKHISYISDDEIPPLDSYYVGMINDTLKQIRSGIKAYLYNLEQVRDVLKFEPNSIVTVVDNIYHVELPTGILLERKEAKKTKKSMKDGVQQF